jgi:hypothetical protein
MPEAADEERHEGLNLTPPAERFELYRHENTKKTKTWARRNEAGDYEIRAVTGEGEAYAVTGGVFPKLQVALARALQQLRRCPSGDVLAVVRYHRPYHAPS